MTLNESGEDLGSALRGKMIRHGIVRERPSGQACSRASWPYVETYVNHTVTIYEKTYTYLHCGYKIIVIR
jgi:hypothetical protein